MSFKMLYASNNYYLIHILYLNIQKLDYAIEYEQK